MKHKNQLKFLLTPALIAVLSLTNCSRDSNTVEDLQSGSGTGTQNPKPNPSQPSSTRINPNEIVYVEGGTFLMGSVKDSKEDNAGKDEKGNVRNDDKPQHKVTLSSYRITKFEITNEQFAKFLTERGNQVENRRNWYSPENEKGVKYTPKEWAFDFVINGKTFTPKQGREKLPIRFITWEGARAFAQWAGGRLPTEAEWEYASKGGKKSRGYIYSGSDDLNEVGWNLYNSGGRLHTVGEKKPNELGLYDMSGNVWEWTADWYGPYSKNDQTNPKGPDTGSMRVRRGASAWCIPARQRSVNRSTSSEGPVRHNMGFRVAFDIK